ncbi:hypothetical protein F4805DRAFT_436454 [Annulohypoxylon moriforme]|nr:hypothetical protein F4805DRAFT_436454 [Annulohypoxylon moriforme]
MELSSLATDLLSRPYLVLKHEQLRRYYSQHEAQLSSADWSGSRLNPKNRIDNFDISGTKWRVDGATGCGTQFFVVPLNLLNDLEPLRIDVFIRDQLQHPPHLRDDLGLNISVSLQDNRALARLGISHYICRALDEQCIQDPLFLARYRKLPFGSRLIFTSINPNPKIMKLLMMPAFELEREALSVRSLQALWPNIPEEQWPKTVDLSRLRFMHQIHESITLVHLVDEVIKGTQQFVFKSNTEHLTYLYNELRFLLQCPPHPNIMPSPIRLVTKQSNFGGKAGVFGFLLPYYPRESIRNNLASLSPEHRLKVCVEVTSAMIHIQERCKTFYSDLRPDNVLLSGSDDVSDTHAILCDFEQRGNHYDWCPPEILLSLYSENLQSNDDREGSRSLDKWPHIKNLAQRNSRLLSQKSRGSWEDSSLNQPWANLNPLQQERAMVYTLGLFIYAVFEGLGDLRRSIMHNYPINHSSKFPQMRQTPLRIGKIIWRCTRDAPGWGYDEWSTKGSVIAANRLSHHAGYVFPTEGKPIEKSVEVTVDSTIDMALKWWHAELTWANEVLGNLEKGNIDLGSGRPSLRDVLTALQDISINDEGNI